jgi:proteasome lid subunit RPN8/RPN11
MTIRLHRAALDAMLQHALEDAPVECCGVIVAPGKDSPTVDIVTVRRAKNTHNSPFRFEIHPLEYGRIERALDEESLRVAGVYHSHTGTEARPSPTDIRMMDAIGMGPPFVHFVVGVADRERPHARAFTIEGGSYTEHPFEVVDD